MAAIGYAVDVIADGEQLRNIDLAPWEDDAAERIYAEYVVATQQIAVRQPSDDVERTVRLIEDGNVIREATIRRGDILAELNG